MKSRLTLPIQWSLTLLLGLVLGYVFQPVTKDLPPVLIAPTEPIVVLTSSPAPFVNLPGGWLVRITFHRQASPEIVKVIHLDQARLTTLPQGTNQIQVLDESGLTLYTQSFQVEFLAGDPPKPVDQKDMVFVLPSLEGASQIIVQSSNGKDIYDFPNK
jgi:hypothetical protein